MERRTLDTMDCAPIYQMVKTKPWLEAEVLNLGERLEKLENLKQQKKKKQRITSIFSRKCDKVIWDPKCI